MADGILTLAEVARLLKVTDKTVYTMAQTHGGGAPTGEKGEAMHQNGGDARHAYDA